jgi:hypothetical protein
MKRKRVVIVIFSFLAVVILGALLWPHEREPEYDGVPLSAWLERSNVRGDEFARAIKRMGTNALPFLVRAVEYQEPCWRTWLRHTTPKWPEAARGSRFGRWLLGDKPVVRAETSVFAFGILGADANPALAELRRIEKVSKDPATSRLVSESIQCIIIARDHRPAR